MKTAIVLFTHTPFFLNQASQIDQLLGPMAQEFSQVELWLFYSKEKPVTAPGFTLFLSDVVLIPVKNLEQPESCLALLEQIYSQRPCDMIVFGHGDLGTHLATRTAFRKKGSSCLNVTACRNTDNGMEIKKSVYASRLSAALCLSAKPWCLTFARQSGSRLDTIPLDPSKIVDPLNSQEPEIHWVKYSKRIKEAADTVLENADLILALGQGVQSKKNAHRFKSLARLLNARIGASRPVVMNGWADMNQLIGVSGLMVSPKICITAGVSGSGYFTMGIKDSEQIVAINSDPDAPIFQVADVGIVDDLNLVLLELEKIIQEYNQTVSPEADTGLGER